MLVGTTCIPPRDGVLENRIDQLAQLATATRPNQYHKQFNTDSQTDSLCQVQLMRVPVYILLDPTKGPPTPPPPLQLQYASQLNLCTPYSHNMCTLPATGLSRRFHDSAPPK